MPVPFVKCVFDKDDPRKSSRELAPFLFPGYEPGDADLDLDVKALTQGTTNGLFMVTRSRRLSSPEAGATGAGSVLVKVYGEGTEITIDRNKELKVHELLSEMQLSSAPLVRFTNGHAYQFIPGNPCSEDGIAQAKIWRAVARELARWHAMLPTVRSEDPQQSFSYEPCIWSTAKKWLDAILSQPSRSMASKEKLREEFEYLTKKLLFNGSAPEPLVLGHGDLLCGNIIAQNPIHGSAPSEVASVRFIDYEHATYCPRAFELANHFAEWAGFQCNYNLLPTKATRRDFIREYLEAYADFTRARQPNAGANVNGDKRPITDAEIDELMHQVDAFRGFPGFYWGLCALIQAETSTGSIDFDYSGYAEKRFAEYRAWRSVEEGKLNDHGELPLREKRWAALYNDPLLTLRSHDVMMMDEVHVCGSSA
ncbi:hypothetical protein ACRALDRAFT_1075997 [Sodiomyces alcalophilus JCM 7366]|uniref:uncharacterized protein n=1 Tax=Sodiomyces alcalophilus JCM 7366 TaxID=591952 RepID=UPI0039B4F6C2